MTASYKSIVSAIGLLFALSASASAAPGDLDPTFGSGGIVITRGSNIHELYTAQGMAIQSDGKIVVVGEGATSNTWDFAVVRYNPGGSLDASFGGTGKVVTPVGNSPDQAFSVAIQADGKIVVVGVICNGAGNCSGAGSSFAVVRYNPDGSLDTSFDGTGKVITTFGGIWQTAYSVAIQADGKIVVAGGSGGNGSPSDFALARYNADGSLDTTFNGTGKVVTPGGGARSVVIQADGKIVAAGIGNGSTSAFTLVRYNADGTPDTSFNGTGMVITSVGNSSGASDLVIQTDGKIVAAGYSQSVPDDFRTADFAVVRYNPNGSLDSSFGGTGEILIPIGDSDDGVSSVAIQPNGKIVAAGYKRTENTGSDFAVVRLNPNGSPDTSFNGTGIVIATFSDTYDHASSVAIQANGKIVVAGHTGPDEFKDFVVVRYQGDDVTPACPNPIDCADHFVRQHYRDFLSREPDAPGLAFWANEITSCGADAACAEAKRVNVSAAFFLSIENQETGFLAVRAHKAAFGDLAGKPVPITLRSFLADQGRLANNVIVGTPGWPEQLEANKTAYFVEFVQHPAFIAVNPLSLNAEQYVDSLFARAGVIPTQDERGLAIAFFGGGGVLGRAAALRSVAESPSVRRAETNRAFVLMQYFGYLRRNPDDVGFDGQTDPQFLGYNFWLAKLEQFDGNYLDAEMVKAFISSIEYRRRFGQP